MKNALSIFIFLLFVFNASAQYYKQSRKNKAFLISNAFSLNQQNSLTNSFEFGTRKTGFLFHGGILASSKVYEKETVEYSGKKHIINAEIKAIGGFEVNALSFQILNLSKKSYCKYLYGFLFVGIDGIKSIESPLNKNYGYRAKSYLSFCIYRTGSHKKDIGYVRHLQLGYCYTKPDLSVHDIKGYHGVMLNFLIIKNKLIKFADWY